MEMEPSPHRPPPQARVLVLPLPVQGHISPMLQFAKRLASKGLKATLTISDCHSGDDQPWGDSSESRTLAKLIRKLDSPAQPVVAVIYDAFMPWALDVAKRCNKLGVAFFTQSCAVNDIHYHVQRGLLELPLSGGSVKVPGLPPLEPSEMPSFLYKLGSYPGSYDMVMKQFSNVGEADLVLFNTFYELEKE
ncbi:Glycosyltransferase, partial [Psidium guajava]